MELEEVVEADEDVHQDKDVQSSCASHQQRTCSGVSGNSDVTSSSAAATTG